MKNLFTKKTKKTNAAKETGKNLNSKRLILDLTVLACVILLGITGWVWWNKIVMNPDRVLNEAINNSLQARSITKHIKQSGGMGAGDIDQIAYINFYPPSESAFTRTVLSQGGDADAPSITTETIGTSDTDYVRYTAASNTESLPGAEKLSSLYGIWGKRTPNPASGDAVTFFNESIYGIIPFGDLDNNQRSKLKELIDQKNIYQYKNVERRIENKRPVYVYELTINPVDLVGAIKEYLEITGMGDPSQLNPEDYKNTGSLNVQVTIDILSRQLLKIEYPTGRVEDYKGHNLYKPIETPKDTIPVEELQNRLQGA